ncbi:type I methionyl aminopeptidase [Patescibacteria group bacterium]|nr:type I methionyl aminopeptidase [Patescibacteria group bacterium]MDE1946887.1 type I methionyl aminopeptidase [Patescibacteria group bacterium]MDE2010707.1 type I methionyl aminopeptidase [Patescibacteria group bacterium]MDE2232687.1 type I methionyl aminopeptidase [Patescibacteria group bacterium]
MITIKTKEEISILREGGRRHADILRKLAAMVKPGISAAELNDEAERLIAEGGDKAAFMNYRPKGAKRPYPAALCVSVNDEVVHGIPNECDKILKEGDIVSIDLGLTHEGLITDAAVTVPVGQISPALEQLLRVTKEALMAGIKAAKGGKKTGDIGAVVERTAVPYGYGIVEILAGHGVGYEVHEMPYVPNFGERGSGDVLKPGMVIAIEPMFNLGGKRVVLSDDDYTYKTADGSPSAHFEHTVLITKGNAEILTM